MSAIVFKIHSDFYYVKNSDGIEFECKMRDVLKKRHVDICVGDFVELSEDKNFIIERKERFNALLRPHVANIDCAVIVCSLKEPELNLIQLNRYLTYLKYFNIEAMVCFNKLDLDTSSHKEINEIYENLGYKTFFTSAKNKSGIHEIKKNIKDKTIVLCGMSGVGKSTLLNALMPYANAKTANVSKGNLKGRHTTRHCEIKEYDDFKIVDTPGFSCLKFDFLLPNELIDLFDDLKVYKDSCKFSDCLHNSKEKGVCAVFDNLDKIPLSRYESYLCFLDEALSYREKISKTSIKKEQNQKVSGHLTKVKISKRKRDFSRKKLKQNIENY